MKMEQTECSETSAYKLQTPGNYPKESIQHTEHGESLKSRIQQVLLHNYSFLIGMCDQDNLCVTRIFSLLPYIIPYLIFSLAVCRVVMLDMLRSKRKDGKSVIL